MSLSDSPQSLDSPAFELEPSIPPGLEKRKARNTLRPDDITAPMALSLVRLCVQHSVSLRINATSVCLGMMSIEFGTSGKPAVDDLRELEKSMRLALKAL